MKDTLVQQCLNILKREDVKKEFKMLLNPIIDFVLYEINPYIYITVSLVFILCVFIIIEINLNDIITRRKVATFLNF